MAKPSITKRSTKGAALTYSELDTNFDNLKDATLTLTAGSGGTQVVSDLNGTITLVAGSGITLAGDNSAKTITITGSGGGGSIDIVNDTTPQLGGNLDTNGYTIVSASDSIVKIGNDTLRIGDGSGGVSILTQSNQNLTLRDPLTDPTALLLGVGGISAYGDLTIVGTTLTLTGSGGASTYLTTNSTSQTLYLRTNGTSSSAVITVESGTNGNIRLAPNGTGKVKISSSIELGTGGAVIAYDSGATKITFDKAIQTSNLKITTNEIQAMNTNGNIKLTPDGTGKIQLGSLYFPTSDGTANQVLKTDGAGNLSWVTAGSGFATVVLSFGTAVDVGGGIEKCTVSETIDTGSICTVSGYDFTLPAGTYIVSLATRFHTLSTSWAGGDYSWTSVSGDSTISSVATMSKPSTTSGIVYQNITTITLTQTSTFYQRAPTNNAFSFSSAIPKYWTFVKTA